MCLWHDMSSNVFQPILLQWIWNPEAKCVSSLGVGVLLASNLFLPHSNGSIYIEFISMTWKCWPSKWPPIFQALHWNAQYKPKRLNCLMIGSITGLARTCEHGTVSNILQDPKYPVSVSSFLNMPSYIYSSYHLTQSDLRFHFQT